MVTGLANRAPERIRVPLHTTGPSLEAASNVASSNQALPENVAPSNRASAENVA